MNEIPDNEKFDEDQSSSDIECAAPLPADEESLSGPGFSPSPSTSSVPNSSPYSEESIIVTNEVKDASLNVPSALPVEAALAATRQEDDNEKDKRGANGTADGAVVFGEDRDDVASLSSSTSIQEDPEDPTLFVVPVDGAKKRRIVLYTAISILCVLLVLIAIVIAVMKSKEKPGSAAGGEVKENKRSVIPLSSEMKRALGFSAEMVKDAYFGSTPPWANADNEPLQRDTAQFKAVEWMIKNNLMEEDRDILLTYFALASFFYGTNGMVTEVPAGSEGQNNEENGSNGWNNREGWMTGDHCSWFGVTCYNTTNHVWKIDLHHNGIHGTLVPEVFLIPKLFYFSVWTNEMIGTIPMSIGLAKDMEVVDLEFNEFEGTIPEEVYGLENMRKLWLGSNALIGTISNNISNLNRLTEFHAYVNQLTGTIPRSLFTIPGLVEIDIIINKLEGTIPLEMYDLSSMQYIGLSDNKLEGYIPENIGNLVSLQAYHISKNKITGSIPESIGNCQQLEEFRMFENDMTGTIPDSLYTIGTLEDVSFSQNRFEGTISSAVSNLINMKSWWGHRNDFSGTIPIQFGELPMLREFYMHKNTFIGTIPEELVDAPLWKLYLWGNKLSGSVPEMLWSHPSISELHIADNELTGTISPGIQFMQNATAIQLENNKFEGAIPEEIGFLNQLDILYLQSNNFSGTVPGLLCELVSLSAFHSDCSDGGPVECKCCTSCCADDVCIDRKTGLSTSNMNRRVEVTDRVMPGLWDLDFKNEDFY